MSIKKKIDVLLPGLRGKLKVGSLYDRMVKEFEDDGYRIAWIHRGGDVVYIDDDPMVVALEPDGYERAWARSVKDSGGHIHTEAYLTDDIIEEMAKEYGTDKRKLTKAVKNAAPVNVRYLNDYSAH